MKISREYLEDLYDKYNHFEYIDPDPLHFVYNYSDNKNREIAGLIAAALAYGRVKQIMTSVSSVLEKMEPDPFVFLLDSDFKNFKKRYRGFKHRFTTDNELIQLLMGISVILKQFGSIKDCFKFYYSDNDENYIPALKGLWKELLGNESIKNSLLPDPQKNSSCKRLHLYLRWMIRADEVDPGCWSTLPADKLIFPLDTHIFSIGRKMELTKRNTADIKTAIEITEAFKYINSNDPVKYDFALTRFGIRDDMNELPPWL